MNRHYYSGTYYCEKNMGVVQAYNEARSFITSEMNLASFEIVSISVGEVSGGDTEVEFEFHSPTRICLDDFNMIRPSRVKP